MKTPKQQIAEALVGKTIRDVVIIAQGLMALQSKGKVEASKTPEKPKFRPVLKRRHEAMPGEVRKLEKSYSFKELCAAYNVPCTHRQASKYLQKRGRLYTAIKAAK